MRFGGVVCVWLAVLALAEGRFMPRFDAQGHVLEPPLHLSPDLDTAASPNQDQRFAQQGPDLAGPLIPANNLLGTAASGARVWSGGVSSPHGEGPVRGFHKNSLYQMLLAIPKPPRTLPPLYFVPVMEPQNHPGDFSAFNSAPDYPDIMQYDSPMNKTGHSMYAQGAIGAGKGLKRVADPATFLSLRETVRSRLRRRRHTTEQQQQQQQKHSARILHKLQSKYPQMLRPNGYDGAVITRPALYPSDILPPSSNDYFHRNVYGAIPCPNGYRPTDAPNVIGAKASQCVPDQFVMANIMPFPPTDEAWKKVPTSDRMLPSVTMPLVWNQGTTNSYSGSYQPNTFRPVASAWNLNAKSPTLTPAPGELAANDGSDVQQPMGAAGAHPDAPKASTRRDATVSAGLVFSHSPNPFETPVATMARSMNLGLTTTPREASAASAETASPSASPAAASQAIDRPDLRANEMVRAVPHPMPAIAVLPAAAKLSKAQLRTAYQYTADAFQQGTV